MLEFEYMKINFILFIVPVVLKSLIVNLESYPTVTSDMDFKNIQSSKAFWGMFS